MSLCQQRLRRRRLRRRRLRRRLRRRWQVVPTDPIVVRKLGSQLEVLVQMPPANEPDLNKVIDEISSRPNVQTFRDRDSRNERAVREALHLPMLEKHKKKKG